MTDQKRAKEASIVAIQQHTGGGGGRGEREHVRLVQHNPRASLAWFSAQLTARDIS